MKKTLIAAYVIVTYESWMGEWIACMWHKEMSGALAGELSGLSAGLRTKGSPV